MVDIKVNSKGITKGKNQIDTMLIPCDETISNVEELLSGIVHYCVGEYNARMEQNELLQVLSEDEICNKEKTGKIGFGVNNGEKKPDLHEAVKNAIQSFEDGIVVVFINGKKMEHLRDVVELNDHTEVTFVKLTMLAGRMW